MRWDVRRRLAFERFTNQLDLELMKFFDDRGDFFVQLLDLCFEFILTPLGHVSSANLHQLHVFTFSLDFFSEARDSQ